MAGSKCTFLSQAVLDHVLGGSTYAQPANVYAAASTNAFDPTADANEPTDSAYARVEITNDSSSWSAASAATPSVKSNINDLTFPTATASWGDINSVYLYDAATAGNALYGSDLATAETVNIGGVFQVDAGTFVFSED